jgi:hypothetical protein
MSARAWFFCLPYMVICVVCLLIPWGLAFIIIGLGGIAQALMRVSLACRRVCEQIMREEGAP